MGLREQIKNANSESEITSLLTKAQSFEFAADKTKKSWKSTARFRLAQLSSKDVAQNTEKSVESKKSYKKKKGKFTENTEVTNL